MPVPTVVPGLGLVVVVLVCAGRELEAATVERVSENFLIVLGFRSITGGSGVQIQVWA